MSDDDKAEATPVSEGSGTSSTASSTSSTPVKEYKSSGQKQRAVGCHDINACIKKLKQQQTDMRVVGVVGVVVVVVVIVCLCHCRAAPMARLVW